MVRNFLTATFLQAKIGCIGDHLVAISVGTDKVSGLHRINHAATVRSRL